MPTLTELGHSLVFANWRGFFGPPDMPPEMLQEHLERLDAMRGSDAWQEVLERRGWDTLGASGADFAAFLDAQEAELRGIMEPLGFVQSSAR